MNSHRKRREPVSRWRERYARATTPDERLAVAYDRLRELIARLRKRIRDVEAEVQAARQQKADNLAAQAARLLHEMCDREEESQ